jgi:rod shape-determining protein MreD
MGWISIIMPPWIVLVLIFWAMVLPDAGLLMVLGFIMGLFLDEMNGVILGEHALAIAVIIYLVASIKRQLAMFFMVQQTLCIVLLLILYKIILYLLQGWLVNRPEGWQYWISPLCAVLWWPGMLRLLHSNNQNI